MYTQGSSLQQKEIIFCACFSELFFSFPELKKVIFNVVFSHTLFVLFNVCTHCTAIFQCTMCNFGGSRLKNLYFLFLSFNHNRAGAPLCKKLLHFSWGHETSG